MSIPDSPKEPAKPCLNCDGTYTKTDIQRDVIYCRSCGFSQSIANWNRLNQAMQVFQTAEQIGNDWWIANKGGWEIGGAHDGEYGSGDTLAAALLKLAKNIQAGEK